jgi:hypothetical protein
MAQLTAGLQREQGATFRLPYDLLYRGKRLLAAELGRRRQGHSGTDAMAMDIHPTACRWIATCDIPVVLGEGQRLGTQAFLQAAVQAGRRVDLLWLDPPDAVCRQGRASRGTRQQNPQWVQAATTRATRLAAYAQLMAGVRVTRLADRAAADRLAVRLRHDLGMGAGSEQEPPKHPDPAVTA